MSTSKRKRGNRDAASFMEELLGGPLTLGQALAALREAEGESMATFSARLGVSRSHLNDIEKGRKLVSAERAARFADALQHSTRLFVELAIQDQLRAQGLPYGVKLTG